MSDLGDNMRDYFRRKREEKEARKLKAIQKKYIQFTDGVQTNEDIYGIDQENYRGAEIAEIATRHPQYLRNYYYLRAYWGLNGGEYLPFNDAATPIYAGLIMTTSKKNVAPGRFKMSSEDWDYFFTGHDNHVGKSVITAAYTFSAALASGVALRRTAFNYYSLRLAPIQSIYQAGWKLVHAPSPGNFSHGIIAPDYFPDHYAVDIESRSTPEMIDLITTPIPDSYLKAISDVWSPPGSEPGHKEFLDWQTYVEQYQLRRQDISGEHVQHFNSLREGE
jgi:hypothetical protein